MEFLRFFMLYFSQILKRKVEDSADATVGRLKDVLIDSREGIYNPLLFLLVGGKKDKEFFVPYHLVENLSANGITLKTLTKKIPEVAVPEGLIYLNRDVLDQQIVDVDGARVVRVNDIKFGQFENEMSVLGLDVSFQGILRRLGLNIWPLSRLAVTLIDWRKAQPVHGTLKLDSVTGGLSKLHPADLANIVEELSVHQGSKLMGALNSAEAAKVLEEIQPRLQKVLINNLGTEKATKILEKMSTDEIVDLLQIMPQSEAKSFLSVLKNGRLSSVQGLFEYPHDTAGGLMTTDFIRANPNWTAQQAIEEIRKKSSAMRSVLFVYVLDENNKFIGPVSMRNLILSDKETKVLKLAKSVDRRAVLRPHYTVARIVKLMTKYDLYNAAVVDRDGKMIGVVSIDDVMRELAPHA